MTTPSKRLNDIFNELYLICAEASSSSSPPIKKKYHNYRRAIQLTEEAENIINGMINQIQNIQSDNVSEEQLKNIEKNMELLETTEPSFDTVLRMTENFVGLQNSIQQDTKIVNGIEEEVIYREDIVEGDF